MKKLFAVYLGGVLGDCHIELHDVRFVAGETIDHTLGTLLSEWIGDKKGVHMDAYVELKEIDGFEISLTEKPASLGNKLYFINLGGYDRNKFCELHEVGFFVAGDAHEAKKRAKTLLLPYSYKQHTDDLFDVDNCIAVETAGGLHIQLTPRAEKKAWAPLKPDWCGYRLIK